MSVSAHNTYPGIKPDLRQGNRRSSDIEQQAYAAVGRRFAADDGPLDKGRILRVVLAGAASIIVVMLVTLVALLAYENSNSAQARKVAAIDQPAPHAPALAPAAKGKPVVIIDEKEDAPLRPATDPAPLPPLVLLSPAVLQGATPAAPARPALTVRAAPRLKAHARAAAAAGRHLASKAAKRAHPQAARKGARVNLRKTPPPVKRKAHLASMAAPVQQGAGALGTVLSHSSMQRRYLGQPLPSLLARLQAPRRRFLNEP